MLDESGKFETTIVTDYKILDSAQELGRYDVLILNGAFLENIPKNTSQISYSIGDQAKKNLLDFVCNGKGFYAQHLASASWESWEDFAKMEGRRFVRLKSGHAARVPFEVKIENPEHAITKGMKDFTADDECYARLSIYSEVDILATAFAEFSKAREPMVMAHEYGKGHVVISTFGHDVKAMSSPEYCTLLLRSIAWAATGKASDSSP